MSFLTLANVNKSYGATRAVADMNLSVDKGEFVSLLGPSGCGKTTTLQMIAGFCEVTSGQVTLDGRDITHAKPNTRGLGIVFQSYALFPHMSVYDNVSFGLEMRRVAKEERAERVKAALALVHLEAHAGRYPRELSGGQRQRVAMGRAIVRDPKVFLFDEPLSNLDAKLRVAMRAEIKALHQRLKTTTVYVTHDQIEAMTMADRIVVMHDGIIEQIGTPLELFDRPGNLFVAQFIGSPAMNILKGVLRKEGGRAWVEAEGHQWPIGQIAQAQDGQHVHYGVRPGDLSLSATGQGIPAKVIVVEPTGAETELLLEVGGAKVIVVMHGRTAVRPDEIVHLDIAAGKTHVFDDASGARLD